MKLNRIKKHVLQTEEKLKYVILAKSCHPDICTGLNQNIKVNEEDVRSIFDDQNEIKEDPETKTEICLHKVDWLSSV